MAAQTEKNKDTSKNNDKPAAAAAGGSAKAPAPPAGFVKETSDVVGYWDGDAGHPILGVPQFVNLMDGNIEEHKPTCLVFIKVLEKVLVKSADGQGKVAERDDIEAQPGDLVGIWFSAGMRDLAMTAGRKTYVIRNPKKDKDTGKPSKMKAYDVLCEKGTTPKLLQVREDRRKESAAVHAAPFTGPKKIEKVDSGDAGDDMPF